MKHIKLFEEFITEDKLDEIDYTDSPFKKCPELCVKKKTATKMQGELSKIGEMAHLIFTHPGVSEKEIVNMMLDLPLNTPQKDTYSRGGHQVTNILSKLFSTPYVKRTSERPARYYAHPDPTLTIEELEEIFVGAKHGKSYGI
jgi:hypothetical protein